MTVSKKGFRASAEAAFTTGHDWIHSGVTDQEHFHALNYGNGNASRGTNCETAEESVWLLLLAGEMATA